MDTNILLENGTNELEVLEFTLNGNHYGINVAKIREILTYQPITPIPNAHPSVEGIFMPRDVMITVISLKKCLGLPATDNEGLFIILDFEKIVTDISPETGLKVSDIEALGERNRNDSPILVAEDSPLLGKLITDSLKKAGYTNIIMCMNGKEAWDKLVGYKNSGNIFDKVHCIITDIEMPIMDGHRLTKLTKTDDVLKQIPLIIFSSLVNDEMRRKGEALGADAQLTKPEIGLLVEAIDGLIDKKIRA